MIFALNLSSNNFNKCEILKNRCMNKSAIAKIDRENILIMLQKIDMIYLKFSYIKLIFNLKDTVCKTTNLEMCDLCMLPRFSDGCVLYANHIMHMRMNIKLMSMQESFTSKNKIIFQ